MQAELEFALKLADLAEAEILPRYRRAAVERKADGSEVTEADRAAEHAIRDAIATRYPDHGVLGEEFGEAATDHRLSWVIDPLDGTRWFALGVPLFGTLIALLENGDPVLGVIHMPVSGETVYARRGGGCWFRTRDAAPQRVSVTPGVELATANVSASGLHATALEPAPGHADVPLERVIRDAGAFRFCGDCLQHSLVCRGVLHAAVDTIMAPWDIAAIVPCIREAGGVATTLAGQTDDLVNGGSLVTSSSPELHAEVLERLRPASG
ncbi:MAG: inositol monophosphatase family protein [Pseudomonadota bacterium]